MSAFKSILVCAALFIGVQAYAQLPKVYDETLDPMVQIDNALAEASAEGKFLICQVGGNWCPWCLKLADFIKNDPELTEAIERDFVYCHINYPREEVPRGLKDRLGNAGRFGFPVLVVMDGKGNVIHIQDSEYLEEGKTYNRDKLLRFLKNWTPSAVSGR